MARLADVRRRFPVGDRAAYDEAYTAAELAGRLGERLHRARTDAGLTAAELAVRLGVGPEDVERAEEGGPPCSDAFFVRVRDVLAAPDPGDDASRAGGRGWAP